MGEHFIYAHDTLLPLLAHIFNKLWLFDTLVTSTLLYGEETWGLSLNKANHWKDLERYLVLMLACMIRSKESVPHDIIRAKMGATPIITEALFQLVTFIQRLW